MAEAQMKAEDMTVTIYDLYSRLDLTWAGAPDEHYPPTSYLTRVAITSGPFSVTIEAYALGFAEFLASTLPSS